TSEDSQNVAESAHVDPALSAAVISLNETTWNQKFAYAKKSVDAPKEHLVLWRPWTAVQAEPTGDQATPGEAGWLPHDNAQANLSGQPERIAANLGIYHAATTTALSRVFPSTSDFTM